MSFYNDRSSENGVSIIGSIVVIVALIMCGVFFAMNKEENAHEHARHLGLKNYKVYCDRTPWACGCTITWDVEYGKRTEKFACCGWGCE